MVDCHAAVGDSAETVTLLLAEHAPERAGGAVAAPLAGRAHPAAARPGGRAAVRGGDRLVAGAAARRAVRAQQALDRRLSGRRLEPPRGPRARRGLGRAAGGAEPPPDGQVAAVRGELSRADRAGGRRRRPLAALSLLSRLAARAGAAGPRRARRVARRMEVGRHPRPADPAPRRDLPLVARRGADHRALSRDRRGGGPAARRRGARWRGAGLGRGRRAAVRRAADADRPRAPERQGAGRGAGRLSRLRSAGGERRGPARAAARRAPPPPRGAARRDRRAPRPLGAGRGPELGGARGAARRCARRGGSRA